MATIIEQAKDDVRTKYCTIWKDRKPKIDHFMKEALRLFAKKLKKRKLCASGVCYVLADTIDSELKQEGIENGKSKI